MPAHQRIQEKATAIEGGEIQPGTFEEPDAKVAGGEDVTTDQVLAPVSDASIDLDRLGDFLMQRFPDEVTKPPGQPDVETAVDVAIRLLTKLSASAHPSLITRCAEEFCNKPLHHDDEHGWINVG